MNPVYFQGIDAIFASAAAETAGAKNQELQKQRVISLPQPTGACDEPQRQKSANAFFASDDCSGEKGKKKQTEPLSSSSLSQSSRPYQPRRKQRPHVADVADDPQKLLRDSEAQIKTGLAILVQASKSRHEALKANNVANKAYDEKDVVFANLKKSCMAGPTAAIGNNVYRASQRNEVDTAVLELGIKKKCDIVYDEAACLKFYNAHTPVLTQMAVQYFSRRSTAKCSSVDVSIQNNSGISRIIVRDKKPTVLDVSGEQRLGRRGILLPTSSDAVTASSGQAPSTSTASFDIKGVPMRVLEKNFVPITATQAETLMPCERSNLDVTKAEASHVFSTLRRIDIRRPLYFAGNTFWQRKPINPGSDKTRWSEVVGWNEKKNIGANRKSCPPYSR